MVDDNYRDKEFKKKLISENSSTHILEIFLKNFFGVKVFQDYKKLQNYSLNENIFIKKNGFTNYTNFSKSYPSDEIILENEKKFFLNTISSNYTTKKNMGIIKQLIKKYKKNIKIIFLPYNRRLLHIMRENTIFEKYKNFRESVSSISNQVYDFTNYHLFNTANLNEIRKLHHDGIHIYPQFLSIVLDEIYKCINTDICEYNKSNQLMIN